MGQRHTISSDLNRKLLEIGYLVEQTKFRVKSLNSFRILRLGVHSMTYTVYIAFTMVSAPTTVKVRQRSVSL